MTLKSRLKLKNGKLKMNVKMGSFHIFIFAYCHIFILSVVDTMFTLTYASDAVAFLSSAVLCKTSHLGPKREKRFPP